MVEIEFAAERGDTEPGGNLRRDLVARLWRGIDPLSDVNVPVPVGLQGGHANHPYLDDAIDRHRPGIVLDVGDWQGSSALAMARRMRKLGCDGLAIVVDTWLGSSEDWVNPAQHRGIPRLHGLPMLYYVFLKTVIADGLQYHVLPLPLDPATACSVLTRLGIRPVALQLRAMCGYGPMLAELERWWKLLQPGGTLIVDDYGRSACAVVQRAVDDFKARTPHTDFAVSSERCRFSKPTA